MLGLRCVQTLHLHLSRTAPLGSSLRPRASAEELDTPSSTSSHRFLDRMTGEPTPLQEGVATNGEGC
ncbi:uncharacterized protein LACBIDRAFT_306687 [Laccaria bicolor S238N-H82]|uniref:Predicted protein n=1 Tax=Laccaria bicolor (strain S238N-H82 / ATCC MYA-4686) TaxID=486041 RepID=B0DNJ9_LACBS|nr:uncharacterized protein LACBIDRAFT_306687 [Laccaria bicolor S238N-H82]EDR03955.1 predicted protein [Laccaria bicolor S238N-H82]|eukprot:XP_001885523.1 predicted protein [Laccaria bicolor S238N-H82]